MKWTTPTVLSLLLVCVLPMAMLWAGVAEGVKAPPSQRPNILFLSSDSFDGRLVLPDSPVSIPNIRKFQQNGVTFNTAYSNSPECCPSRSSLWSGMQVDRIGAWNNGQGLPWGYLTMMDHVAEAGYLTDFLGKTDIWPGNHSLTANLTAWLRTVPDLELPVEIKPVGVVENNTDVQFSTSDWAVATDCNQWLSNYAKSNTSQPFMLSCGWDIPHPPFITNLYWNATVDSSKVTIPPWIPLEEMHPSLQYSVITKNCSWDWTDEELLGIRSTYYAMVAESDGIFGSIVDTLEQLGLSDNTIVFFWSDHGEMAMEQRQFYKMVMNEGSARVMMLVSGPGIQKNASVDRVSSLIDWYPTIMDLLGINPPEGLQGFSLAPDLVDNNSTYRYPLSPDVFPPHPGYILSQYHSDHVNTGTFMVRYEDLKYIYYVNYPPQLFNLTSDPFELNDLSDSEPDLLEMMGQLMLSLIDPIQADAAAKRFDLNSFVSWKIAQGDNYESMIGGNGVRWVNYWDKDPQYYLGLVDNWVAANFTIA